MLVFARITQGGKAGFIFLTSFYINLTHLLRLLSLQDPLESSFIPS